MPGFLDRVRQLLSVGNSLPVAFARAVQGAQPPLTGLLPFAPAPRRMSGTAPAFQNPFIRAPMTSICMRCACSQPR